MAPLTPEPFPSPTCTGAAGGRRSLLKGGAAGLAGAAVSAGSQFLIVVAVTRGFDARTAGAFFTATTLCLMVAGILRLDCGNGLIYFLAGSTTPDRHPTPDQPTTPTPNTKVTSEIPTEPDTTARHTDHHTTSPHTKVGAIPAAPGTTGRHTDHDTTSGYIEVAGGIRATRGTPFGHLKVALPPVVVLSLVTAALVTLYADPLAAVLTHSASATIASTPPAAGPGAATLYGAAAPAAGGTGADPTVPLLASALRTLALALPVIVVADILVSATRGFGAMRPTALLSGVLQPGLQLLCVGAVVLINATGAPAAVDPVVLINATGAPAATAGAIARPLVSASWTGSVLAAAWAAPALPVLVLSALWLRRRSPSGPHVPGTARAFWRYTAPRALGGAAQAVFQRLDIVIVAVLAGPAQAAVYTAATRFKVIGQLVNQGFAQAVQPRLVRALAEGDLPLARRLYQMTTMWLVLLTWPIWLGYAVLAPWLLRAFGDGYPDGAAVAVVLAATMMLATACGMADVVLIAAGHTAASMAGILSAIAVTVALDVVLVPSHGALGAALGWSGGMLVKNLAPLLKIVRRYGLRPFGADSLPSLRVWRPEEAT
ncbi:lipopolysaccharide biosynthesis protein [Sphaerisporangium dianthi]|uniref:Lipopolysaccharide biosynthesis protein n=1 Tax=Sphaerisporangium dianthi TaxID=1436120 RepID=A0ABV9CPH7_9ACTN